MGTIIKKHQKDIAYRGYTHHASEDEPQYESRVTTVTTSR
jgi:hypothetical protein